MENQTKKEKSLHMSCAILEVLCNITAVVMLGITVFLIYNGIVTICKKDKVNTRELTRQEQIATQGYSTISSTKFNTPFYQMEDSRIYVGFFSELSYSTKDCKSNRELAEQGTFHRYIVFGYIYSAILMTILLAIFWLLSRMLSQVQKDSTPFTRNTLRKLKRILLIFLLFTILKDVTIIGTILLAIPLWCLYTMFDIGSSLQKQADETL